MKGEELEMGLFNRKDAGQRTVDARTAAIQHAAELQARRMAAMGGQSGMNAQEQLAMGGAGGMNVQEMIETRDRVQRINTLGVNGTGTVVSARNLGPGMSGMSTRMEIDVNVTSGPGAPRTLTVKQEMVGDLAAYAPGAQLTIRINPQNPDEALVWSAGAGAVATSTAPVAAGGGDMASRLQQLADLRDRGALTPEEFAQQKQRILAAG